MVEKGRTTQICDASVRRPALHLLPGATSLCLLKQRGRHVLKTARLGLFGLLLSNAALAPSIGDARSLSGAYLAAQQAEFANNFAQAARYYAIALSYDPSNPMLADRAMRAEVARGDVGEAIRIATTLEGETFGDDNALINILGVTDALKEGRLTEALERLDLAGDGVMPLVATLWRGWIFVNMGEEAAAFDAFAAMTDNDTTELFARYHAGLAHVAMGEDAAAAAFLADHPQSVSGLNAGASLAQVLLLNRLDRTGEALAVLDGFLATTIGEEGWQRIADALRNEEPVPDRVIERPTQGFARVLYDVASVLGTDNSDVAILYLRLALYLDPDMWDGWLLMADLLERQEQIDLALAAYGAIPTGVVQSINAQLGRASVLETAERVPEALEVYAGLVARHPSLLQIRYLQAQTLRRAERYEAAIAAYSVAIELAEARNILFWQLLNGRAVTRHQVDDWLAAEADFRAALVLAPNQPFVLNYLGYSLVERNEHLDEALDMIERAVEQRPNSGFIVDSLGWVYFILERFEEAVPVLERAVALEPVDPVINDHLGDAYWMAGRKREAEFQWHRALSFDPEPKERARILRKLDVGLYKVRAAEAAERETLQDARNVD